MHTAAEHKTSVFISYRRKGGFLLAKYIYDKLRTTGYDVFMDVHSLGAGEFEHTTLNEIATRDYFLLVITAGSLDGMTHPDDWLRKELSQAVKYDRNVIPVLADGLKFEDPEVRKVIQKLPAVLRALTSYNAIRVPDPEYFDSAMERLMSFLKTLTDATPRDVGTAGSKYALAQSVLQELTLPPAKSLPGTESRTPWSDLQASLIGSDPDGVEAPHLTVTEPGGLRWTKVATADRYVLQESTAAGFGDPTVIYEGSITHFDVAGRPTGIGEMYYRVKAVGGAPAGDSAWSNVVSLRPPLTLPAGLGLAGASGTAPSVDPKWRMGDFRLPALYRIAPIASPVLRARHGLTTSDTLTWTEIDGAVRYVLEESFAIDFTSAKTVHEGSETSWTQPFWLFLTSQLMSSPARHYRVKAVAADEERSSGWSNTATVDTPKPVVRARPAAPELSRAAFGTMLIWTEIDEVEKYVLQRGMDAEFQSPKTVYEGPDTRWFDLSSGGFRSSDAFPNRSIQPPGQTGTPLPEGLGQWVTTPPRFTPPSQLAGHYRVKAIGTGTTGESDWSNVVTIPLVL